MGGVPATQVVRLQERSSSYLAELEELKTARSSKSLLGAAPGGAAAGGVSAVAAAVAAKSAAADKELMLKQIDSLKEVRSMCCRGVGKTFTFLQTGRSFAYFPAVLAVVGSHRVAVDGCCRRAPRRNTCAWRCGSWSPPWTAMRSS